MQQNLSYDDYEIIFETAKFYKLIQPNSIQNSRKKRTNIKIQNNSNNNDFQWTCQQAATLLNLLPDWILSIKSLGKGFSKMILTDPGNPSNFISFKIFPNFRVEVKASLLWVITNWSPKVTQAEIYIDDRKRPLKKPKENVFYYDYKFDLSDSSTLAIIHSSFAFFYTPEQFSDSFNHFCHYLYFQRKIPTSIDDSFICDFIKNWVKHPEKEKETNFETFKNSFDGYISFDIAHDDPHLKRFPIIDHKGEKWRIVGGIYISNLASDILNENPDKISGFLLDSTFRAIPKFVTAIIMASIYNVGVPLAFSFSVSESEQIYQRIYNFFQSKLNINLSQYVIESDQGKALNSFFSINNIENIVCNRHLLLSLKKTIFSYQIGNIVSCRSQIDLDASLCTYSDEFNEFFIEYKTKSTASEYETMKNLLKKLLEKVGMTFSDTLVITDKNRWKQVSLFERIQKVMPSTTNSLESSHGHINENIPRRHNFFHSLNKLVKWSNRKISNFQKLLSKNFDYIVNKSIKKLQSKSSNDMIKECKYYQSTMFTCNCGEVSLESKLYRTPLKCSHMLFCHLQNGENLDAIELPKCPDIKLQFNETKKKNSLFR